MNSTSESQRSARMKGADKARAEAKDKRQRLIAWALGLAGALPALGAVVFVVAFLLGYSGVAVPSPSDMKQNQVAYIYDTTGRGLIARVVPPEGNRTDVTIAQIPRHMQDAVIAAEDRRFRTNAGFDLQGIGRAVWKNLTSQADAGGGSTITQQYVKNAIVGDASSLKRKFKELTIATKMSNEWTKDDIMVAYLNTIYFGRNAWGISSAAQTYFGHSVEKLTVAESAVLAASIRSPSYYDPAGNPPAAQGRWHDILTAMVDIGALDQSEMDVQKYPVVKEISKTVAGDTKGPNGLLKSQILAELATVGISESQLQTDGLKIYTTIDPVVQQAAVERTKAKMEGEPTNLRTAVVSVEPSSGAVRGYYGGDIANGWDNAVANHPAGSTFKIFALAAALENDMPLSTRYSSSPYTIDGTNITVNNSEGMSCGTCNLATALKMSLNTVFYRLMMDLPGTAQAVADAAHKAGIPTEINGKKSLQNADGGVEGGVVLGQYDTRVIDMASAFATFAASGIYHKPHFIDKVTDAKGAVLYRHKEDSERKFSTAVADNISAAMVPIASYSNGHSLSDGYQTRPSAAKTGTNQLGETGSNRDAWMVGYTPQLATAVWMGTANGTDALVGLAGSIYGSGLPSEIWQSVMNAALEGKEVQQFPTPEAVGGQAGIPYEPPPAPAVTTKSKADSDEETSSTKKRRTTEVTRRPRRTIPGFPGIPAP